MNIICRNECKIAKSICRYFSYNKKSHYDVLELSKNCSDLDIRKAFIKLSKKFHPDVNTSPDAHQKYVEIVEAYNVLGKSNSRVIYDNTEDVPSYTYQQNNPGYQYHQRPESQFYQQWDYVNKNYDEKKPYYGFEGYDKTSHGNIVLIVLGIVFAGVCIQIMIIKETFRIGISKRKKEALDNAEIYERIRTKALQNSNEMQVEILKKLTNTKSISENVPSEP